MTYDLAIIGGGINGAAIARDAAGRGLSVLLVEQHDLASHTSSASTKLIHGGLRYLEHYEFGLVRKALAERELLLGTAPHIMHPQRFVIPHEAGMRPRWLIRCGLFLYDHLARRDSLPGSRAITLADHPAGAALQARFTHAFEYSDGWVDDARFVLLNALDAAQRGATVMTRTTCQHAKRGEEDWLLTLQAAGGGQSRELRARALVNATGPWTERFLGEVAGMRTHHRLRLVRGSHIVVPRLFAHDYAYLFQAPDRRIVFALPYEQDFTLIGTTELEHLAGLDEVQASEEEIAYLCAQASRYFRQAVTPQEVRWHFAGLRPLLDDDNQDAGSVTRDYLLALDSAGPPVLSVFGGKLTTCRKLAEQALDSLQGRLGGGPAWTAQARLPGADWTEPDFGTFLARLALAHPGMPTAMLRRMAAAYGTRITRILGATGATPGRLGDELLPGLHAAEVAYLCNEEWARTAEDILWRRSKLGLHLPADAAAQLAQWLEARASLPRA